MTWDDAIRSIEVPAIAFAAAGSLWSAVWSYVTSMRLKRLGLEEESFKITHSPRVASAIELWAALSAYERRWLQLLGPSQEITVPPGTTPADWERLSHEHRRELWRNLERSWNEVAVARDRAEILLPPKTFERFDALFDAYGSAHERQRAMHFPGIVAESVRALRLERDVHLARAKKTRSDALAAFQLLLGLSDLK